MARKIIKFTKKDKQFIQDFTNSINKDLIIAISENKRFECDIPNNTIYLGLKNLNQIENNLFKKWLKNENITIKMNRRLLSLLHEIGHFQTFNEQEFEDRNSMEKIYNQMYENDLITFEELNFNYWNMTNEKKATLWGIQYYLENTKKCKQLVKILKLNKFVKF